MDMKKLLKSNKYLEEIQCKSMIYDILCGLNYLHKASICHRDLKPENILVNDDCTIQICDFGLSRSLHNVADPSDIEESKLAMNKIVSDDKKTQSPGIKEKVIRPSLNIFKNQDESITTASQEESKS